MVKVKCLNIDCGRVVEAGEDDWDEATCKECGYHFELLDKSDEDEDEDYDEDDEDEDEDEDEIEKPKSKLKSPLSLPESNSDITFFNPDRNSRFD